MQIKQNTCHNVNCAVGIRNEATPGSYDHKRWLTKGLLKWI